MMKKHASPSSTTAPPMGAPMRKAMEAAAEGGLLNDQSGQATEKARKSYKRYLDTKFFGHRDPSVYKARPIRTSVKSVF